MKKSLRKKDGYVLVWVILLFLVVSLLSTVVISGLLMTVGSTTTQQSAQQAYYSAKSAVSSVADYIIKNAANPTIINNLISNPGSGSTSTMGNYTVTVTQLSSSRIRVTATAMYQGATSTVTAYLVAPPAPSGIIPTDNVIYVNGSAASGFGQCAINGSVYINGNFNLSQGSAINGSVVANGTTTITGSGNTTNGLVSFGNVYLDNSAYINGDLLTKGDLKMLGNASVVGNASADGSLNMSNGSSTILKNAIMGMNASFGGGANRISGSLTYGGTLTCSYGSITTFVTKGGTKVSNYTPLDFSSYSSLPLPILTAPTSAQNPALYNTVAISNNTISNSGTITSSIVTQLNNMSYGSIVTIDASSQDISLLLNNTNFTIGNGLNLVVNGTKNVFIYLKGTSTFTVNSNEYIGMKVRGSNPNIFIIGDGTQSISLNNNSEMDACVYIPNGSMSATGSPLTTYKFIGACIVKSVNIDSGVKFQYSKPNLLGTPLAVLQTGQSGSSSGSSSGSGLWTIGSWDNH